MNPLFLLMPARALATEPTTLSLDEALRLVEAANRPAAAAPPPAWTAERAVVTVTVEGDDVRVVQELRLVASRSVWIDQPILDGKVHLDTRGSAIRQGPDGNWWLTTKLDGPTTLRLEGTMPRRGDSVTLKVFPAVRQEVRTVGEGLHFEVDGRVDGFVPPTDTVAVRWRTDAPRPATREVVTADVAAASWWEDDALRARARVRYEVRRGERSEFSLRLPAGAQELSVVGAALLRWERQGDTLILVSREPVKGAFEVTLQWRQPFASGLARVSAPEPSGVTSSSATITLAGSSETLLSPTATGGLRTVALSEIPERSRAIGDETPAAAWSGKGALEVRTLNLESIDGPPLVIDRARCTAAHADSGRSLMNCRLDVRNISRQYLVVRPGEGTELWAARVNGDGVPPVRLADGDMAIPLEKSVETVAGLITLDVELTFLSEEDVWLRRGERELALPSFDAPVARLDWELRLPPGYEAKTRGGTARLAGVSSATIVYATTATTGLDLQEEAARASWNQALRAYQQNDWDTAQSYVDQTILLDPDNENAARLQDNLDVLKGEATGGEDEAMSRRVKDMAKAKVVESEVEQEESMNAAEEALMQGDYDKAIAEAEKAIELSKNLSVYEQKESTEQAYRASSSAAVLERAREGKRSSASGASGAGYGSGSGGGSYSGGSGKSYKSEIDLEELTAVEPAQQLIDFDDIAMMGELVQPEGELLLGSPDGWEPPPPPPEPPADETQLLLNLLGTTGEANGEVAEDLFSDGGGLEGLTVSGGGFGMSGYGMGGGGTAETLSVAPDVVYGGGEVEIIELEDYANEPLEIDEEEYAPPEVDEAYAYFNRLGEPGSPPDEDGDEAGGVEGGVVGGVVGGVLGGSLGGVAAPAESRADSLRTTVSRPATGRAETGRAEIGQREELTITAAPKRDQDRGPAKAPASTPQSPNAIPTRPALAATTLAIPLPDHGEHVAVTQSLLEPWESPTLTLRYREKR